MTISDTTLAVAGLNTLDGQTTGAIDAATVTTITGTAAAAQTAFDSAGITGLGNEAVTLSDTTLGALALNNLDAETTGTIDAATVTTLTGTVADANTAYGSAGVSGLGNEAVTISDTTLAVAGLNTLDGFTTGVVNAASVTTLTGSAAALNTAYASSGISGLGDEAVTIDDTTIAATVLNTLDGYTSGTIDATTVTTITGAAATVSTAYSSSGFSNLGNEAVTLSDTTLAVATLNTLDGQTSGAIDAATITTLTGTAAAAHTAYTSGGITGLGNEAVTVSGTNTVNELATLNGDTTGTITFTTANATTSADTIDLSTGFNAGTHTIKYTAGNQASSAAFTDVAGAALANTDTFTLSGAVDVLTFMNGDALDLSAFGLLAQSSNAQFSTTGTKVGDGEYKLVVGSWAANVFTANAAGSDLLVVWDANSTTSVSQVAVVILGVNSLDVGTELVL